MTGGLAGLVLASIAFVGAHIVLSSKPIRDPLVGRVGPGAFIALYSAAVALPFIWMIWAYRQAPYVELWDAPTAIKHISLTAMIVACIFAVAAISPNNPAVAGAPQPNLADGPTGIFRITRHPLMWAIAIWAATHLMANGNAASVILFGAFLVLAIAGTMHIDARKRRLLGAEWEIYARQSSHIPFVAIAQGRTRFVWSEIGWRRTIVGFSLYIVLLVLHEPVIGMAPVSIVAGIFG